MGRTSSTVKNRWNGAHYDRVEFQVKKGTKDLLQAYCEEHGKSVGGLVKELLQKETGIDFN